jgi:hypothetical protein
MRSSLAVLTCLVLAVALAVSEWPDSAFSQEGGGNPSEILVYKPPMRGAPAGGGRVGAAVRGENGDNPALLVLAPDHVGVTSQKQPVLYWYISKPTTGRIEFTLNDELRGKTVVRADLPSPKQAGIQEIRFSDYKAELAAGVVYQWFVTLEIDPSQPAKDVYYGGSIVYQEATSDLQKRLAAAGSAGAPAVYAGEGLWYDALGATLSPGKKGGENLLRQQRVTLLKQVGFGASGPGKPQTAVAVEDDVLQFIGK